MRNKNIEKIIIEDLNLLGRKFESLNRHEISTYDDVKHDGNCDLFIKLFDVFSENRDLSSNDISQIKEYNQVVNSFINSFIEISKNYSLFEIIVPPVEIARKMKRPGVYELRNNTMLTECVKECLRMDELNIFYIPSLKFFIEAGHDFIFTFYKARNIELEGEAMNIIQDIFIKNKLIIDSEI